MTSRRERLAWIVIVALYAVLTLATVLRHEPWRDEADVWLAVRDDSLVHIGERGGYSGTPLLWYALVAPLARAGLPYLSMNLLNWLFALATAAVLAFRLPLPRLTKILLIFSYTLAYEYAVVARNYAVGTFLLVLFFATWRGETARTFVPALALALSAHASALHFAIALTLAPMWFLSLDRQRKGRSAAAAAIVVVSFAAAAWVIWPRPGGQFEVVAGGGGWEAVWWAMRGMVAPVPLHHVPELAPLGIFLFVVVAFSLRRSTAALYTLLSSAGVLFAIFVFKHATPESFRHFGLLLLAIPFALWIDADPKRAPDAARRLALVVLNVVLAIQLFYAARFMLLDWRLPYSGAAETARFLREHGLSEAPIAAHRAPQASALLPYLPRRTFHYLGIGEEGSFMRWDRKYAEGYDVSFTTAAERYEERYAHDCTALLLVNAPLAGDRRFELMYASRKPFAKEDEQFFVYRGSQCAGSAGAGK